MNAWFREQMAMYTAYHTDIRNRATHFAGVPLIVYSLLIGFWAFPLGTLGGVEITAAALILAAVVGLYLIALPLLGVVSAFFMTPILWAAERTWSVWPEKAWLICGAAFVSGWIIQFVGHAFEGRRPALADNLLQVFMAPGFLIAEVLFALGLLGQVRRDLNNRAVKYAQKT